MKLTAAPPLVHADSGPRLGLEVGSLERFEVPQANGEISGSWDFVVVLAAVEVPGQGPHLAGVGGILRQQRIDFGLELAESLTIVVTQRGGQFALRLSITH